MGNIFSASEEPRPDERAELDSYPSCLGSLPQVSRDSSLLEKENRATAEMMDEHGRIQFRKTVTKDITPAAQDNSGFENTYSRLELPVDEEGYCMSFSADDPEGFTKFFKEYGVVVVRDVLTAEESARSELETWEFLERTSDGLLRRDDPTTWKHWPSLAKLGILGPHIVMSKQFCENRQNPIIHRCFAALLGTDDLWGMATGRASCMRPTRGVRVKADQAAAFADPDEGGGAVDLSSLQPDAAGFVSVDKPSWRTVADWVHLDMDPWTGETTTFAYRSVDPRKNCGYDFNRVQGFVSLVDCGPEDGGFQAVPGFHKHLRGWAHANRHHRISFSGSVQIPKGDPLREDAQKVAVRRGSLVVWSSMIPHGTFPNNSNHGRMIQYLHHSTKDWGVEPLFSGEHLLPPDVELTPLGRRLFGVDLTDRRQL
mmetsp:Transcript_2321/g.5447  ORF Transcript_2321/g.5447 Transcript_2321/m.5447 type:complete len:427 (-) Transcript_2321:145-1425(-)|eukprot:CAMPEP_0114540272 /NCGR_PEP_ID=MMETSP0114-20121206/674_1 /TAXON_ID=31324 /ORGANISM="Goniomonas sp, Strain m" /LENGTH=426 /DNA_ID=CAMNT_0001724413 /DNA_START=30 /DNA_END=1310 /DNA_ORIENTATION=+